MAAKKQMKCPLVIYVIGMSVMVILLGAAGIVGLVFLGKMNPADIGSTQVDKISDSIQKDIINFELQLYNACGCLDAAPLCADEPDAQYCITAESTIDLASTCKGLKEFKYGD